MKHDFQTDPTGEAATEFRTWLERETIDMFRRPKGDGLESAIFLYVNRAYEAHMPEEQIGAIFGHCFARAGFPSDADAAAFDLLEYFAQIAKAVHSAPRND